MKDFYKINEVSKLYGIGVDSLRYYERFGILKPRRDTNGYRLYNLKDMHKLNVIRDLRCLDFSMQQIKEYLDGQCVSNTLELLESELEHVRAKLEEMQRKEHFIQERMVDLNKSLATPVGMMTIKEYPSRHCVLLSEHMTKDEEMDFMIKKLHQKHEAKILDFGNQMIGAFPSIAEMKKGRANVFDSVFFILERETDEYDFELPGGQYISYYYRGGYKQNLKRMEEVLAYATESNYRLLGDSFELYHIDNRDTIQEDEFLTEIQVRIVLPTGKSK